jgi:protocatechuate 3,4-dioxygenase beta subunit
MRNWTITIAPLVALIGIVLMVWTVATRPSPTPPRPERRVRDVPDRPPSTHDGRPIIEVAGIPEEKPPADTRTGARASNPSPAPGAVRGRIRFDDEPPTPCANAAVFVLREKTGHWKTVVAAPTGDYLIQDLAPGVWKMLVRPVEYPEISGTTVEIKPGEDTVQDFVVKRGLTVTGRVLNTKTGAGVPGARITCRGRRTHAVTAGDDGAYCARGLDADMLGHIEVTADRYNPAWEHFVLDDPKVKSLTIDLKLRPMATVSGVVLDPSDVPVTGARVTAACVGIPRHNRPGTTTDRRGHFSLTVSTGWSRNRDSPVTLFAYRAGFAFGQSEPTSYADGEDVHDVTIRLRRGGTVTGSVSGDVAVAGAIVHLWSAEPPPGVVDGLFSLRMIRKERRCRTTVGPDGRFRFKDVLPGPYHCEAVQGSRRSPRIPAEIRAGRTTDNVRLVLARVPGMIAGRVVDDGGVPVPDVRVWLTSVTAPHRPTLVGTRLKTDAEGKFQADALPDGEYRVHVYKPGFSEATRTKIRPSAVPLQLRIRRRPFIKGGVFERDGTPVDRFRLDVYQVLARGVKQIHSRVGPPRHGPRFITYVPHSESSKRYLVQATTADGRLSERVAVDVTPGQAPEPVRLVLGAGAAIHGVVVSLTGAPVNQASVQITGKASGHMGYARTTISGRFAFIALPPDTYEVRAYHTDWLPARQTIRLERGREKSVRLRLDDRGATIRLTVQTADGRPLAGARVFRCEPNKARHQARFERLKKRDRRLTWDDYLNSLRYTDENGHWVRQHVAPRTYDLLVRKRGYRDREVKITLSGREERTLTVVLEPAGDGKAKKRR